jgi:excisionase family DNA binding protein
MHSQITTETRPAPLVVTMAEAGRLLGLSRMTMHKMVVAKRLRVTRFGRSVRVSMAELERLAKPGSTPTRT